LTELIINEELHWGCAGIAVCIQSMALAMAGIRASGTDVLINLTTGPGARFSHDDADRFLPAVGLMRIRELVARYPDFKSETDFRSDLEARMLGNE